MSQPAVSQASKRVLQRVAEAAGTQGLRAGAVSASREDLAKALPDEPSVQHEIRNLWSSLDMLKDRTNPALAHVPAEFAKNPVINFSGYRAFAGRLRERVLSSSALFKQWRVDDVSKLATGMDAKLTKELAALPEGQAPSPAQLKELQKLLPKGAMQPSAAQSRFLAAIAAWEALIDHHEGEVKAEQKGKDGAAAADLPRHVEDALVDALIPVERAASIAIGEARAMAETSAKRMSSLKSELTQAQSDLANIETLNVSDEAKANPELEKAMEKAIATHDWNMIPGEVDREAH